MCAQPDITRGIGGVYEVCCLQKCRLEGRGAYIPCHISNMIEPLDTMGRRLYCLMMISGIVDSGIYTY